MKENKKSVSQESKLSFNFKKSNRYLNPKLKHNYFYLSTKKITLMAMILSLNMILTIFSRYILGLIPIFGFFVIEISFVSILIYASINNFFYSFVFLEITIWFRLILGSEPIGLLAMNLVDGFFLIVFYIGNFILTSFIARNYKTQEFKKFFIWELLTLIVITILTSATAVVINFYFLLPLYFPLWTKAQILTLLPVIFGLNIGKYVLNFVFYLITLKPLIILSKRYEF